MTGKHQVIVKNARIQYKFEIERNITILQGDSATGKTTLIDMLSQYERDKENSGITLICDKKCVVLTSHNWELILPTITDSIVFIDEGDSFVKKIEFARAIQRTDNYYVIATRALLVNLPYSVKEVYGIKNKSGNRYQGTKRLYSSFYPLHDGLIEKIEKPDHVIVEDSNSGYAFFKKLFGDICCSANGKSNVFQCAKAIEEGTILVVADGAAFGSEIENLLKLKKAKNLIIYLPESFEWLILKSGLIKDVDDILNAPYDYIDSRDFFSWERFFTDLLTKRTNGTYLKYTKVKLNPAYTQENAKDKILSVMPKIVGDSTVE